jgi:superfamily I DNA and/or RNA helicase
MKTSKLKKTPIEIERQFAGTSVILCTLSTMSNPKLQKCGLTRKVLIPEVLIVDEASQIQLADYIPVFHRFHKSLKRVCFVGDYKQRESCTILICLRA